jgi:hypothetical protein
MQKVINSAIYLSAVAACGFLLSKLPSDRFVFIVFLLTSAILQYVLLSPFSGTAIWARLTQTVLFLLIDVLAAATAFSIAFNSTVSGIDLLIPLAFSGTIIALHLLWKSITDIGKGIIDPHNQGIR